MNKQQKFLDTWKVILENRGNRKIVLYDTANFSKEENKTMHLEYLQKTLDAFHNKKEEVILLWYTGDPLEKEAVAEKVDRGLYQEIAEQYKKDAWGIFVEKEDRECAEEIADFYFGDDIAKVLLFKVKGKDGLLDKKNMRFYPISAVEDDRDIWMLLGNADNGFVAGLFQINKSIKKLKYIGSSKAFYQRASHEWMVKKEKKLYFIPRNTNYLTIYDIEKNTWKNIRLDEPEDNIFIAEMPKFQYGEFYENNLYLFSSLTPVIVRFDINTEKWQYLFDCTKKYKGFVGAIRKNLRKRV